MDRLDLRRLLFASVPRTRPGHPPDYERASTLARRTEGKVFKAWVVSQWNKAGTGFWYRNDLAGGRRAFVRVDAIRGVPEPAFDHHKLAEALTKALSKDIDADRLPIQNLTFDDAAKTFRFHRSKAFHDVCWKNVGDAGFSDRIRWLKAAAEKYLYMDLSRVGIYGGSAGGQNALRALLAHSNFYRVAVADCGCHDNRMDKVWWNELWMGWPVGPHYAEQSNVTNASKLQGRLLLIVGELDRNVDPASTIQVVNALVKADKDFDLLVIPGAGHGAAETPYGQGRRQDFFVRHLLGVEPRAQP
jgi:dienelactone hydrolase